MLQNWKRWSGLWAACVMTGTLWGQEGTATIQVQTLGEGAGVINLQQLQGFPGQPTFQAMTGYNFVGIDPRMQESGKYWIGVGCTNEFPEALRAQLGLEESRGLLVYDVVAEGPGAQAGVKQHDILLSTRQGDAEAVPLSNVPQLIEVIQKAELKPLTLELLRAGKTLTVTVTPKERELPKAEIHVTAADTNQQVAELRRKLRELEDLVRNGNQPLAVRVAGPVVPLNPNWPGDAVMIAISKRGNEPGLITVRKGTQQWTVAEDKLNELPADVQPEVTARLRATPTRHGWVTNQTTPVPAIIGGSVPGIPVPAPPQLFTNLAPAPPLTSTPHLTTATGRFATAGELQQLADSMKRLHEQQAAAQQEQTKALLTELKALREAIEKK